MPDPADQDVRDELAKIVASPMFSRGEKLPRFLKFVVEEALAGRGSLLKEYNIGISVYERRLGYDTRIDSTVRVEATRLRNKLIEYYAGPGVDDRVRIDLPKGSYVPVFREVRAPAAERPPRRIWLVAALALLGTTVALAALLTSRWNRPVLALAPLVALDGQDKDARELELALMKEIPARANWIVKPVQGKDDREMASRAAALPATYLLTGSYRSGRATITLQTVDAGYRLWSRTFERPAAPAIAEALLHPRIRLAEPGTRNPGAARAYLEGHRILTTMERPRSSQPKQWPPHISESLKHFEAAVAADPEFALAWAAIASNLNTAGDWDEKQAAELKRRAREGAERALQLDDTIASAHEVLANIALFQDWDLRTAGDHYSRAVELDPRNANFQRMYATVLGLQGRFEDAAREVARAEITSPDVSAMSAGLAEVYFLARRYGDARRQAQRAIALNPENAFAHWLLGVNAQLDGDPETAEREYRWCLKKYDLDARAISALAHLRATQGRIEEARRILGEGMRKWGSPRGWQCSLAMVEAASGSLPAARDALKRGAELHEGAAPYVLVDPRFDRLRDTPEHADLARRVRR